MFAKVATDAALDKTFDYIIPPKFESKVMAGSHLANALLKAMCLL